MKVTQQPVGTRLFFVPIRYWEDENAVETGHVAEHNTFEGRVIYSFTHDGFVYAFHDGYGHDVYMQADRTFLTHEAAEAERQRLKTEKKAKDHLDFEDWWQRVKAEHFGMKHQ